MEAAKQQHWNCVKSTTKLYKVGKRRKKNWIGHGVRVGDVEWQPTRVRCLLLAFCCTAEALTHCLPYKKQKNCEKWKLWKRLTGYYWLPTTTGKDEIRIKSKFSSSSRKEKKKDGVISETSHNIFSAAYQPRKTQAAQGRIAQRLEQMLCRCCRKKKKKTVDRE